MDIARLFDCPLCLGIPEREREQFLEGLDYSVKSYMKGDVVFRQGDVCRFLYILLEGEVEAAGLRHDCEEFAQGVAGLRPRRPIQHEAPGENVPRTPLGAGPLGGTR